MREAGHGLDLEGLRPQEGASKQWTSQVMATGAGLERGRGKDPRPCVPPLPRLPLHQSPVPQEPGLATCTVLVK